MGCVSSNDLAFVLSRTLEFGLEVDHLLLHRGVTRTDDPRRQQARAIRDQSEARKDAGAVYADLDSAATSDWLRSANAHTLIHGHTHRPGVHQLTENLSRWVLSDWDAAAQPPRADILRLSANGLQRRAPDGW